jgi:hypothetical protein
MFGLKRRIRATMPALLLSAIAVPTAGYAQSTADTVLFDAASPAGWTRGATVAESGDARVGAKVLRVPVPAEASPATIAYELGAKRDAVARAKTLTFWYRLDGPKPETLHIKIIAAPLAGGYQAIYSLPVPNPGEWQQATLPVQDFQGPWGTDSPPMTTGGQFQFRIGKKAGEAPTLLVSAIRLTPLPAGVAVNTRTEDPDTPKKVKVKPMVTAEAMARLPEHPRLAFTAAEVDGMKRRANETEWGKAFVADLTKRCDDALKEPVNLPPRGGQWYHWYACPKHGARLKNESPTRHVCPTDGEVFTGYPYDDVYLSMVHDRYSVQVRDLGLLYRLTGDKRYAVRAREILLAYADKYESYPLHNTKGEAKIGGGKVGPQTLDESTWTIPMAQGCDAIWDTLSPTDIETLKTKLFYPITKVIQQHRMSIHNIQCWKNSAVGMIGLLFADRELVADAIDEPSRGMQAQILSGITDDGPWYEGAWGYHFYTMSALAPLAEAAHRAGLPLYSGEIGERYKKFYLAPLAMALPNGTLPAFNDSNTANANGNMLYEVAFARWGDVRFADPVRASNRKNQYALTVGIERLPAPATKAAPSEVFASSGYAYLRAGSGQDAAALILKYGPHGGGHGHPDKLHFVLYMGGKMLADDAGITTYGVPVHMGYYKTTLAHNTLVVDEENQKAATGKLLDFKTGNGWSAALADAGPIYDGVTFRRAAFLIGTDAAVFLDMAATTDGKERQFDFAVHPLVTPKLPILTGNEKPVDKPGYAYLRNLTTQELPSQQKTDFHLSSSALSMEADLDGRPTRFLAATGVGRSTEDRIPLFIFRQKTTGTRLAWSLGTASATVKQIAVSDAATNKPVSETDAAAATVRIGDRSYLLIANPSGRAIVAGTYKGNDKLAVVPIPPFPVASGTTTAR